MAEARAPISMCLIVKNEPLLEKSLLSIRDYVKEIVIVDTGSTDSTTKEIAKKYADIYKEYSECNDPETGLIEDFAKARQYSFSLATQPWVAWMDADDIIVGGENFHTLINKYGGVNNGNTVGFVFPYEYSYSENGQCTCIHYRERLVFNKDKYRWVNPVHEVLINNEPNAIFYTHDEIIYKHQRQYGTKVHENGRNLRILKKYIEKVGDSDPRQLYYIGLEYSNSGLFEDSIVNLTKYIDLSGWDDERAMAALKLVDIYHAKNNYNEGLKWAFKTIAIKEDWAEGYFALGRMFYFLAQNDPANEQRNWQRCAYFIKMGLSLPPTKTLLFINPLERAYDIHRYYNMALGKIGDLKAAVESIDTALLSMPNDESLLLNKRIYESAMMKSDIANSVNKLKELGELNDQSTNIIFGLISKQIFATENVAQENITLEIPVKHNLESKPENINNEQLESLILSLWKQYVLYDEAEKALSFLNNVPEVIKNNKSIIDAIELTKKAIVNINNIDWDKEIVSNKKLDIVFFAGDGVEIWTPDTIKQNGIGGSETMLMEQAKRLAALGHNVRVYNSCGNNEFIFDGVQYLQTNKFCNLNCDVLVVSRRADMLADQYNIQARLKLLWVHDVFAIRATNENLLKADRILALTNWHKANLLNYHNVHDDHVLVTRNGIDLTRFDKQVPRNKFKVVNSSSPDRSWPILLDCWGRIKQRVPQAELHLFYGFKNWEYSAQHDQPQLNLIKRIKDHIKSLEPLGVVFHDRVSQEELAKEFLSAGVWAHPTWFTETSCITAMEAQAAGLRIVTSSIAALNETVANRGILIDGDWTTEPYKNKFIDSVVKSMQSDDNSDRLQLQEYAKNNFGLVDLASDWSNMFYQLLDELKSNPTIKYQPTQNYKKV